MFLGGLKIAKRKHKASYQKPILQGQQNNNITNGKKLLFS